MTARAGQAVELIFHYVGNDDRQFGHLMTQRSRVAAAQRSATTATGIGLARDDLVNLLFRDQLPLLTGMARLAAAFLAYSISRRRRTPFAVKAVRGRGQR